MDHLLASSKEKEEKDTLVKEQFSIPVVNVIWRMVASKTFTIGSEEGGTLRYHTFSLCVNNHVEQDLSSSP